MIDDESGQRAAQSGWEQGVAWAHEMVEWKGIVWLQKIEIGEDVPRWRAFKRCADPEGWAKSNGDVTAPFFVSPGPFYREHVDSFIDAALVTFRSLKAKPN